MVTSFFLENFSLLKLFVSGGKSFEFETKMSKVPKITHWPKDKINFFWYFQFYF